MARRRLTLADFEGPNSLNMPSSTNTRGIADPLALQALSWGEDYDVDARRNAIAAAMLAQQTLYPGLSAAIAPSAPLSSVVEQVSGAPQQTTGGSYGLAGGQQAGDASSVSMDALGAASAPGYGEGAPGAGMGIGRGGGETSLTDPGFGGAMTTSNASMVGEDSMGGGQAVGVPGYGRSGDDTSAQSQAAQGRDAAAMAAAAQAAGRDFSGSAITGPLSGPGFGAMSQAAQNAPGFIASATGDPLGGRAVSTTSFTAPSFTTPGWGRDEAPDKSPSEKGDPLSMADDAAMQGWGQPGPTLIGTVTPGSYTQPGGRSAVGDPNDPGATSTPGGDFSAGGWGGFGGFGAFGGGAATGGYEGSASMSNTGGAQGFSPGGGGFADFGAASPGFGGMSAGAAQAANDAASQAAAGFAGSGGFDTGGMGGSGGSDSAGGGMGGGSEGSGSSSDSGAGAGSSGVG